MIPLLKKLVYSLLWDELAAIRWLRGTLMTFAAGGIAFADQLADVLGMPTAVKVVKVTAIVCGFLAGAITAGQKNPVAPE
jgi:hypothetical protein